ncbi:MAG: oxidoreductase [Ignavibacteriae bacterium]|nr:oxidoreductase [Ignavibacteriota bacterium]
MLKVGIIGTGHLGKLHTKLFKEITNCELIGIHDIDEVKLNSVSKEFAVEPFFNIDDLLNKVDAVSIVSTTSAHYKIAKKALENGKHVFVEKPITARIDEGEEIVELAKKNGLNMQVGHIERFNPALLSLEKFPLEPTFIQSDRLSQFNLRGTDVAVVHDLMIHDIDIILSLVKSDVKQVNASGVAVVTDNIDIANARIEFVNGTVANVTASRISQKKMRKMRMFQKDAYITLDFTTGVSEIFRLLQPGDPASENLMAFGEIGVGEKKKLLVYEQPELKEVNALKYELQLFVNSILEKKEPMVTGADGLKALKVAEEIITKINESRIQ